MGSIKQSISYQPWTKLKCLLFKDSHYSNNIDMTTFLLLEILESE